MRIETKLYKLLSLVVHTQTDMIDSRASIHAFATSDYDYGYDYKRDHD